MKYYSLILDVLYRKRRQIRQFLIISGLFLFLITISNSTSFTTAHFTHHQVDSVSLSGGTWWDKSNLYVSQDSTQNVASCPVLSLDFYIHNTGFKMIDSTTYTLYYSVTGNPLQDATIYKQGVIPSIGANDVLHQSFENVDEGNYLLRVNQHPLYNNETTPHYADSAILTVKCKVEKQKEDVQPEKETTKIKNGEPMEEKDDIEKPSTPMEKVPTSDSEQTEDVVPEDAITDKEKTLEEEKTQVTEPIIEAPAVTNEPLIEEDTQVESKKEEKQADTSVTE